MKRLIVFKSLILATLFLLPTLMSCSDDDSNKIETGVLYSEIPAKFNIIETWFENNPTIAPTPSANTLVSIEEGKQIEDDHSIGEHYYEIDIDDYYSEEKKYDVEFYLNDDLKIIAVVVNDVKVTTPSSSDYTVAEAQLRKDYNYTIGDIAWSTQREYQLGTFAIPTKSDIQPKPQTITAWYEVSGETATREMDSKNLGVIIPDKIKEAFNATKYSDATVWRIEEVELEHNYNSTVIESYYEVEVKNIQNPNLEAELFFSATTAKLLYSKEELDDDNDGDDDKFVVNAQLKAAVEKAVPGAIIIDAEIDDNIIEVDAIVTIDKITKELELEFTMNYELISSETETKYTYSTLPVEFNFIKTWFANNTTIAPTPSANIVVEITEGKQTENDHNIGVYYYEVEIDDYYSGAKEYEVEFYFNEDFTIIAVIVDDKKVNN